MKSAKRKIFLGQVPLNSKKNTLEGLGTHAWTPGEPWAVAWNNPLALKSKRSTASAYRHPNSTRVSQSYPRAQSHTPCKIPPTCRLGRLRASGNHFPNCCGIRVPRLSARTCCTDRRSHSGCCAVGMMGNRVFV